jgi:hypothetical protein
MRRWKTGEITAVMAPCRQGLRQLDVARAVGRPPGSIGNLVTKLARQGKLRFRQSVFGYSRAPKGLSDQALCLVLDDG